MWWHPIDCTGAFLCSGEDYTRVIAMPAKEAICWPDSGAHEKAHRGSRWALLFSLIVSNSLLQ
jgi:hypothetical protein